MFVYVYVRKSKASMLYSAAHPLIVTPYPRKFGVFKSDDLLYPIHVRIGNDRTCILFTAKSNNGMEELREIRRIWGMLLPC